MMSKEEAVTPPQPRSGFPLTDELPQLDNIHAVTPD